jgi:hypothetical protein
MLRENGILIIQFFSIKKNNKILFYYLTIF